MHHLSLFDDKLSKKKDETATMVSCCFNLSDARSRSELAKNILLSRRRKGEAVLLLASGVEALCFMNSEQRWTDRWRHACALITEEELWPSGHKVVGRAPKKKRQRMNWKQRLEQIGSESEFRMRYKISSEKFKEICDKIRNDVEARCSLQGDRGSGGII